MFRCISTPIYFVWMGVKERYSHKDTTLHDTGEINTRRTATQAQDRQDTAPLLILKCTPEATDMLVGILLHC